MQATSLLRLSRALHGVDTLEAVMEKVRDAVCEGTRYRRAYIHRFHEDETVFDIVGWVLPNQEMVKMRLATIDMSKDRLIQRANTARDPYFVEDLRLDPDADQKQVEYFGNRTAIVVPMFEGDKRIGPLVVATYADQGVLPPTPEEFDFLIQVGSILAVVIGRLHAEEARKKAEESLARALKMEALGTLAGGIAHDFNNLLVTILVNVELAGAELGQEHAIAPLLRDAEAATLRAARLTKQLLASSRGQILTKTPLSLDTFLASIRGLVEKQIPDRVKLIFSPMHEMLTVEGDRDQLERVFMNLILNARDAIDGEGTISVDVSSVHVNGEYVAARKELRSGSYALVSVSDDGAGMSEDTQSRIFEPFFTTKPAERGTGLGLSVVLGIVEQHGGHVHVYSEIGLGTTFKVYLPLTEGAPRFATEDDSLLPAGSGGESILVVDDDEDVRRSIERILHRAGYLVHSVESAKTALEKLASAPFDLVLTDIVMGDIDGVTLSTEAASLYPDLPFLFMTGYSRGRLSSLSLPHLTKPFSRDELLKVVRRCLDRARRNARGPTSKPPRSSS